MFVRRKGRRGDLKPRFNRDKLIAMACKHYNGRNWDRDLAATPDADSAFLDRICVNYLRHAMTQYDEHLDKTRGKVGVRDAYLAIKGRVLDKIAQVYPFLAAECKRQIEKAESDQRLMDWAAA